MLVTLMRGMLGFAVPIPQGTTMPGEREVIFEIRRVGAFAKVSAVDVATGMEVSVSGPATADDALLRQLARRRLEQSLRAGSERGPPGGSDRGGGRIV
jgi:hypothetical protein